jgi:hypothetical protein
MLASVHGMMPVGWAYKEGRLVPLGRRDPTRPELCQVFSTAYVGVKQTSPPLSQKDTVLLYLDRSPHHHSAPLFLLSCHVTPFLPITILLSAFPSCHALLPPLDDFVCHVHLPFGGLIAQQWPFEPCP